MEKTLDFMRFRHVAMVLSGLLLLVSVASLATRGLNFGLDFTGGTLVEVSYEQPADLNVIRQALVDFGFDNAVVQHFGAETEVMIRLQRGSSDKLTEEILAVLRQHDSSVQVQRIEFVGPQVGDELKEQGGLALLLALAMVMVYVAVRFQYKFSVASVAALVHDVLIVLGLFSLFQWDFDLTVLAALLAVIGYSLNDTIVVADRIRENFRLLRKGNAVDIINESLTQVLSRTVVTSLTTLIVLLVLFFAGGDMIRGFSLALTIGVLIGTYSSIYVASSILVLMGVSKDDLIVVEKDQQEFDSP
ncbi:MAG TPA: protein translocase subunit SecF [Pseudomonadales bacterium]